MGPAGPQLPPPLPIDVGKAAIIRDLGAGPVWIEDFIQWNDLHGERTTQAIINTSGGAAPAPISPSSPLHLVGGPAGARLEMDGLGSAPSLIGRRANGTAAASTQVKAGDALIGLNAHGYGLTGYSGASRASIYLGATEDWTDAAQGSEIYFSTTLNGSAALAVRRWQIGHDGAFLPFGNVNIGSPAALVNAIYAGDVHATTGLSAQNLTLIGGVGMQVFPDPAGTYSRLTMDTLHPSYWTWTVATKTLSWSVDDLPVFALAPGGALINPGAVAVPAKMFANTQLQVVASGVSARIELTAAGASGSLVQRGSNGTTAAPSATKAFDALGSVAFGGYGATKWSDGPGGGQRAWMIANAAADWTDASQGTILTFATTPIGSNAPVGRYQINDAGHFLPLSAGAQDLGRSDLPFRNGYFSGSAKGVFQFGQWGDLITSLGALAGVAANIYMNTVDGLFYYRNTHAAVGGSALVHNSVAYQTTSFLFAGPGAADTQAPLVERARVSMAVGASQTALSVAINATGITMRIVEVGAADSGGVGYRMLRVAN